MSSKTYTIETITGSRFSEKKKCIEYCVKWVGYDEPTWEPESSVEHCVELLDEYKILAMMSSMSTSSNKGYVYARVSTAQQNKWQDGHTSLLVQEDACKKKAATEKCTIRETISEVYSAKNMGKMKGLQYILLHARAGDTIFVYDVSRFSRNIQEALCVLDDLAKRNIRVYAVTENIDFSIPAQRHQFRIQLCASTHHSEICSAKVKASIERRRIAGHFMGTARYGYTTTFKENEDEKTRIRMRVKDPEALKMISLLFNMVRSRGVYVTSCWATFKDYTMNGRKVTVSSLRRLISRVQDSVELRKDIAQYSSRSARIIKKQEKEWEANAKKASRVALKNSRPSSTRISRLSAMSYSPATSRDKLFRDRRAKWMSDSSDESNSDSVSDSDEHKD